MMCVRYSGIMMLMAIAILAIVLTAEGVTYVVDDDWNGADYDSIQDAINDSESGDIIRVNAGLYNENLVHNTSASVIGNGSSDTRIYSTDQGFAIDFVSNGLFSGFNVTMGSGPMMPRLMGSNTIDNSTFHTGSIFIHFAGGWVFDNCTFWRTGLYSDGCNDGRIISCRFNGGSIYLDRATDIIVEYNRMMNLKAGIGFGQQCSDITIARNRLNENHISFSGSIDHALVIRNVITDGGISVGMGNNVTLTANTMTNGGIGLGSYLEEEILSHTISDDNLVNGRPVIFIKNETGASIPEDPGQLLIANCSWVDVEDLEFDKVGESLALYFIDNLTVSNCSFLEGAGFGIYGGDNLTVSDSLMRNGSGMGGSGLKYTTFEDLTLINSSGGLAFTAYGSDSRITNCLVKNSRTGITVGHGSIRISLNNNTVLGDPDGDDFIPPTGIQVKTSDLVRVENNTLQNTSGISLSYCEDSEVWNNEIVDCFNQIKNGMPTGGLIISMCINNTLRKNTVDGAGILIWGRPAPMKLSEWNSHDVRDNSIDGGELGYFKDDPDLGEIPSGYAQVIVVNCSRFNLTGRSFAGKPLSMLIVSSDNGTITDNELIECLGTGIVLISSENLTIRNTTIRDTVEGDGLRMMYIQDSILDGIRFTGNDWGFGFTYAERVRITRSRIIGNGGAGMSVGVSDDIRVDNCTIKENEGPALSIRGTHLDAASVLVDNNELSGSNGWFGVLHIDAADVDVRNNTISNGTTNGVYLSNVHDARFSENSIVDNHGEGLYLNYANRNNFTGNIIARNGGDGLVIDRCNHNNISNNMFADNEGYGVNILEGEYIWAVAKYNNVFWNTFHANGNGSSQGWDGGEENIWDDNESMGNTWSDYTGADDDGNGIGDTPYDIDGVSSSEDRWPIPLFKSLFYVDDDNADDPLMNGSIDHPFDDIQKALDNCSEWSKVRVWDGHYTGSFFSNASYLIIVGNGTSTIIDGEGNGDVLDVRGAIQVIGVNITGASGSGSGLIVGQGKSLRISDVVIDDCYNGIFLDRSTAVNVVNVSVSDCNRGLFGDEVSGLDIDSSTFAENSDSGIYLVNSSDIDIDESSFEGNGEGLEFISSKARITDSIITGSSDPGISIEGGKAKVQVKDSEIEANRIGILTDNGVFVIYDSVIANSTSKDLKAVSNGVIRLVDTAFDPSSVSCGASARITALNHLVVECEDQYGDPLRRCDVRIKDDDSKVYSTKGYGGSDPRTNKNGLTGQILLVDRIYEGEDDAHDNETVVTVSLEDNETTEIMDMSTQHTFTFILWMNDPPNASITSPDEGEVVEGEIYVRGKADDPDGKDEVEVVMVAIIEKGSSLDSEDWVNASTATHDDSWIRWKYKWNATGLEDGNHSIYAKSHDGDEWSAVANVDVLVVNQDRAVLEIDSPDNGSSPTGTVAIEGTARDVDLTDEIEMVWIAFALHGSEPKSSDWREANDTSDSEPFSTWDYRWNSTRWDDGNYTIHAYAESSDGDDSAVSTVNVSIENFNDVAVFRFTSPVEGEAANWTVSLAGWVHDGDDRIEEIEVGLDDEEIDDAIDIHDVKTAWNNISWSAEWNLSGVEPGEHTIYGRATDARGQTSRLWSVNLTVYENVRPWISFTVLNDTDREIYNGKHDTFTITWIDSDPDDNATISLYHDTNFIIGDGGPDEEGLIASDIDEDAEYGGSEDDDFDWDISEVAPDTYILRAVIDDGRHAEFINTTEFRLTIINGTPNDPPYIEVHDPDGKGDTVDIGDQYSIRFNASDPDDDDLKITLYYDDDQVRPNGHSSVINDDRTLDGDDTSYVWDTDGVEAGLYYILAKANDGSEIVYAYSPGRITVGDLVPPAGVGNLTAADTGYGGTINLTWNAPGDDGWQGDAEGYEIRYSQMDIEDEDDWDLAVKWTSSLQGGSPGELITLNIDGLDDGTRYHFAVRAYDDAGRLGPIETADAVPTKMYGPPVLNSFEWDPIAPVEWEEITFSVTYSDEGGREPDIFEFFIDGESYTMDEVGGSPVDGIEYELVLRLDSGTYAPFIRYRVEGKQFVSNSTTFAVGDLDKGSKDKGGSEDESSFYVLIIIFLAIIATVLFMRDRGRRPQPQAPQTQYAIPATAPMPGVQPILPPAPPAPSAPASPQPLCPRCGLPSTRIHEFQRDYCYKCAEYLPEIKMPTISFADE